MVAVALPRMARALLAASALTMLGSGVSAAAGRDGASGGLDRLAPRLLRLDPGARVGGNTRWSSTASPTSLTATP
jgi:hypothetical protein